MPLSIAVAVALATLIGLTLALMLGALTSHRPRELMWSAIDGLGVAPILLLLCHRISQPRTSGPPRAPVYQFEIGSIISGVVWFALTIFFASDFPIQLLSFGVTGVVALGTSKPCCPLSQYFLRKENK